jgi:hypothetical protein
MKKRINLSVILIMLITIVLPQNVIDDADIAGTIENACRLENDLDETQIGINVIDGIAVLTGTVNNLKVKEQAAEKARLVKGVRTLVNLIVVAPPVVLSDEGIKSRLTDTLATNPVTAPYDLNI